VKEKGLTYLSYKKLLFLEEALREVERSGCPGDVVEAGVARGGAGTVLAKGMSERRRYWGYDSFESMPEPSEEDGHKAHERYNEIISEEARGLEGKNYYGYENELLNIVRSNLAVLGITTVGTEMLLMASTNIGRISLAIVGAVTLGIYVLWSATEEERDALWTLASDVTAATQ